jgi:acetyltransferase-like isoleucine patch superfamily enzyme
MLKKVLRKLDRAALRMGDAWRSYLLPDLKKRGRNLRLVYPYQLQNASHIEIGDDCHLGANSILCACRTVTHTGAVQEFNGSIRLGDRVWATSSLQLFAACEMVVEDDVMFAANVFVCDCQHGHADVQTPYRRQAFSDLAPVFIGAGAWIGQNVVIMPGVSIGRQSIIGANSVVTHSIPDRAIAFGVPARVRKVWSDSEFAWQNPKTE